MRENMGHIHRNPTSVMNEEILDITKYDHNYFPPLSPSEQTPSAMPTQGKNPSLYVNYVDKNGGFMNIHEKIDEEITIPDVPEMLDYPDIDPYVQKEILDNIIQRITNTEKEMEREYEALIKSKQRAVSPIVEESEGDSPRFSKTLFPSLAFDGTKTKWRLNQEKKEAESKKILKERLKYVSNKPKYPNSKIKKKKKVMLAMGGPFYFDDVELKKLKQKMNEYKFSNSSKTKTQSPTSKLELTDKLQLKK